MKLLLNTYPYRFEHGYDLGFGPSCFPKLVEIIMAFHDENQLILFPYCEYDKNLEPHKEMIAENELSGFHYNVLFDPDGKLEAAMCDHLFKYYYSQVESVENEEELKISLLKEFRDKKLEHLKEEDNDLINSIKELLYNLRFHTELHEQDLGLQEFINSRTITTNTDWLFQYEKPQHLKRIIWFNSTSPEDIMGTLEKNDWWFSCVITDSEKNPADYNYFLEYTEEHGLNDGDFDGMVLLIRTYNHDCFTKKVVPKLKNLFNNQLEIIV